MHEAPSLSMTLCWMFLGPASLSDASQHRNTFLSSLLPCLTSTWTVPSFMLLLFVSIRVVHYIWPIKQPDLVTPFDFITLHITLPRTLARNAGGYIPRVRRTGIYPWAYCNLPDAYRPPAKETPLGAICLPSYRAMHAGHIIGALLPKNKRPSSLLADQIVPHSFLCQKV